MNYSLALLNELMASTRNADRSYERAYEPAFEAQEETGHYLLTVDLPGATKNDIQLQAHERTVTVAATRQRDGVKWQRSFNFAQKIDADQVEADYRDGVLSLYLPKHAAAQPKTITVHGADRAEPGFFAKLFAKKAETQAA